MNTKSVLDSAPRAEGAALPKSVAEFLWRQIRAKPYGFGFFFAAVIGAAASAVVVQYGMKLLVDAMAGPHPSVHAVYGSLALFLVLIAVESVLWRTSGVIGSRAIIDGGIKIRLDLFEHLTGHAMRYFGQNLAGALGQRVTQTAGHFGGLVGTCAWNVVPPCIDFLGALVIFASIRPPMAAVLAGAVALVAATVFKLGRRGQPKHRAYALAANEAGGELIDVGGDMWSVKAFRARSFEQERLQAIFGGEAIAQRGSWLFLEKMRIVHDVVLWAVAGGMLFWAIRLWESGGITPGDVVVISALTFRVLHGSRD